VGLERADHSIEDPLHQFAPHRLTPVRRPDLDSDGEWGLLLGSHGGHNQRGKHPDSFRY
jgi:hypothetical protein